jgi:hypothetical protein
MSWAPALKILFLFFALGCFASSWPRRRRRNRWHRQRCAEPNPRCCGERTPTAQFKYLRE